MDEDKRELYRGLGFLSSVGISMVVAILIGLAMGYYLDKWLGTKPIFTLIMMGMGIISGFRNIFIITRRELKRQNQEEDSQNER